MFSGCSTKKVFEPKNAPKDWIKHGETNSSLKEVASDIALFEDKRVISKDISYDIEIKKGYRLLAKSGDWIISTTIDGKLSLNNVEKKDITKKFDLKKTVASASVDKNVMAVLFADNEIALYDIDTKSILFKEMGLKASVVDSRVIPPYFMDDLVLFSTLDGKIIIVHSGLKKKLRTIIVSSQKNFNNIIYLTKFDDKIIAATGTKLLTLSSKEIRVKYESRNIVHDEKNLYVATKQGEVLSLTSDLQLNGKIKFPFAHFLGMIPYKDKLYIVEKEGYLIVLDKNMKDYEVYNVYIEDGYIYIADKTFYIADKFISVE